MSKNFFRFGDQLVILEKYEPSAERLYVLLALHSNETVSMATATDFAEKNGVNFLRLDNGSKKNIEATFLDKKIVFAPENVFTVTGRKRHLKSNKCWSGVVNGHVFRFSLFLLDGLRPYQTIVSIHSDMDRTVNDYDKGGKLAKYVDKLFVNGSASTSNFFITNDESVFQSLKKQDFSVVLMDSSKMKDDGSLSAYCGKTGRRYIHIETVPEDREAQQKMPGAINGLLE